MDISKAAYVPGWLDRAEYNGFENGLDVWTAPLDFNISIDQPYIVGHSLGANVALANWKNNKNATLILVNPLIPKRNFFSWFSRWFAFFITEGFFNANPQRVAMFRHFKRGIVNAYSILKLDLEDSINSIPKEKLVVIVGGKDRFFLDKKAKDYLKSKEINIFEVNGMGHVFKFQLVKEILGKI